MYKVNKFLSLPFGRKKLLAQSLLLIWLIRIGLWTFSFERLNKWLFSCDSEMSNGKTENWNEIEIISDAVRSSSRYVPRASCLTQAFAVAILLRRRGQHSQLKIGVNKDANEKFTAHAWIEINGQIIIGKLPLHQRFIVLSPSNSIVL